jgi:hypothetical protein
MAYQPPTNILQVLQKIEYEEALPAGDERYVETQEARGSEKTFSPGAQVRLGPVSNAFLPADRKARLVLRPYRQRQDHRTAPLRRTPERFRRYYVVEVDVLLKLDRNNLQYSEALMAMAETLLERLLGDGHALDDGDLQPVRDWFETAIKTRSTQRVTRAPSSRPARKPVVACRAGHAVRQLHRGSEDRRQPEERMAAGDPQSLHDAWRRPSAS